MKKQIKLLLPVLLTCLLHAALAQNEKKSLAVAPFTFGKGMVAKEEVEGIFHEINGIFSNCGRFEVVARGGSWADQITHEREIQKTEHYFDGKTVQQGVAMGAELLVFGHVITIDNQNVCRQPNPVVHLSIVDVATSKVLASDVISKTGRNKVPVSDVRSAVDGQIYRDYNSYQRTRQIETALKLVECFQLTDKNALKNKVTDYINEYFPVRLTMFNFEVTKDKVKGFLIEGNDTLFKKSTGFDIVEEKEINAPSGKKMQRIVIAKAKIEEFQGELIKCKVISGGDVLFQKQNDKNVFITTN